MVVVEKKIESKEEIKQILIMTTEFLLKTENWVYVFTTFWQALKNLGYNDIFLDILENFINHRKIKYVTD